MENNSFSFLTKCDKIFFNRVRISSLIDELIENKEIIKIFILNLMLSNYIHFRVGIKSNSNIKVLPLVVDTSQIPLKEAKDYNYFDGISYIMEKLKIKNFKTKKVKEVYYISIY